MQEGAVGILSRFFFARRIRNIFFQRKRKLLLLIILYTESLGRCFNNCSEISVEKNYFNDYEIVGVHFIVVCFTFKNYCLGVCLRGGNNFVLLVASLWVFVLCIYVWLIIIFCGDSALMLHSPPSHVNKSVWVSVCCSTPLGLCVCVNACVCARECVCVCADDTRIEDQRQKKWMKHDRPLGSCYYKCLTRCVMRPVYLCIRREHHQVNISFCFATFKGGTYS